METERLIRRHRATPRLYHTISFEECRKISERVKSLGGDFLSLCALVGKPWLAVCVFLGRKIGILGRVLCELEVSSFFLCLQEGSWEGSACRHGAEIGASAPECFLEGIGAG